MKTFEIRIGDDCAYSTLSRSFTAPVCIRCGDDVFPHEAWTDFPVAMMCMWVEQLKIILGKYRDPDRKAKLFFLDGDFHLECTASGAELRIAFFAGAVCQGRTAVRIVDVVRAIRTAIHRIESIAGQHAYDLQEYDTLQAQKQWVCAFLNQESPNLHMNGAIIR